MSRKLLFVLGALVLLSSSLHIRFNPTKVNAPKSYPVHNLNTGLNYTTIQEAIDAPETLDGQTIWVEEGTYCEHVVINKSVCVIGENKFATILDGKQLHWPVAINAEHVTFSGFTVTNSTSVYCSMGGGIFLVNSNHCNITDNIVINNQYGIGLYGSSNNTIYNNLVTESAVNILVYGYPEIYYYYGSYANASCNNNFVANVLTKGSTAALELGTGNGNKIIRNIIANNSRGLVIRENSNNSKIYHNNFINNALQIRIFSDTNIGLFSRNTWDNGYPSGGNFWSDYGVTHGLRADCNYDGLGDNSYIINKNNTDYHPLMGMFSSFNTTLGRHVNVVSNSTIEDFEYFESNSTIKMYVSGEEGFGFCRVCIPHRLMNLSNISVVIDDGLTPVLYPNYTLYDNSTHRWIYFAYEHSTLKIDIIPEFPSFLILPLFMIATLLTVMVYRRKFTMWQK